MQLAKAIDLPIGEAEAVEGLRDSSFLQWLPLLIILCGYLFVALGFNVKAPLYEAPDERAHVEYVTILMNDASLPSFEQSYQSWQPPLYYLAGAGLLKLLRLPAPYEPTSNPDFPTQPNVMLHNDAESFPYAEPVLSMHVLRFVSTLFGAGTVVFIFLTALAIFPHRRLLAISSAAMTAFLPQFAFITGTVNNDSAGVFFVAAIVYFGVRYMKEGERQWLVASAIALALGALTKSTVLLAGIVPFVGILLQSKDWREKAREVALLGLAPLLFAGWFYARSIALWGNVYPTELMQGIQARDIADPAYRTVFLPWIRHSYWFTGGYMNIELTQIYYDILDAVTMLGIAGVVVFFVWRQVEGFQRQALLTLAALFPLVFLGIVWYSMNVDFQPQGRYLFMAQPAIAILLSLGLSTLFSRDHHRDNRLVVGLPLGLLALNISILAVTLPDVY